jgi:hypothetical protein
MSDNVCFQIIFILNRLAIFMANEKLVNYFKRS